MDRPEQAIVKFPGFFLVNDIQGSGRLAVSHSVMSDSL